MTTDDEKTSSTVAAPANGLGVSAGAVEPLLPWSQRAGSFPVAIFILIGCGCLAIWALHRPPLGTALSKAEGSVQSAEWTAQMRVNVNNASIYDLQVIPGIGPALARKIITDRQKNGPFQTMADLDRVSGIGPRTIQKIAPFLVILPFSTDQTAPEIDGN